MQPRLKKNIKLLSNNILSIFPKYILPQKYQNSHTIIMFHRVHPLFKENFDDPNFSLGISPELFDQIIEYLSQNYEIVDTNDLVNLKPFRSGKLKVVITFDDGYMDNYEYALPILKKYNVPATFYICTRFINGESWTWWYDLWEFIKTENKIKLNNKYYYGEVDLVGYNKKIKAFNYISNLFKKLPYADQLELFRSFNNNFKQNSNPGLFMTWDILKKMSLNKLVTIGAHTENHISLSSVSIEESKKEILNSKIKLENELKKDIKHFAFPFGDKSDFTKRETKFLQSVGFNSAVTTIPIYYSIIDHFEVPRVSVDSTTRINNINSKTNGLEQLLRKFTYL